ASHNAPRTQPGFRGAACRFELHRSSAHPPGKRRSRVKGETNRRDLNLNQASHDRVEMRVGTSKALGAHLWLTPRVYQSGEIDRSGQNYEGGARKLRSNYVVVLVRRVLKALFADDPSVKRLSDDYCACRRSRDVARLPKRDLTTRKRPSAPAV